MPRKPRSWSSSCQKKCAPPRSVIGDIGASSWAGETRPARLHACANVHTLATPETTGYQLSAVKPRHSWRGYKASVIPQ